MYYKPKPLVVVPMEDNDKIDTEANWKEFAKLLRATNREGYDQLLQTLGGKTDFKTAPASHKHHLAIKGGLCQHSLNVNKYALHLCTLVGISLPSDSITIASLLHDLCKIHFYKIKAELDKEHKDKTGDWRKREMYVVEDKFPMGHGEKSVILAQQYGIKLNIDEALAVRWHMGFSSPDSQSMAFKQAWSNPLVQIVAMADQLAVTYEDNVFMKKKDV